mmetsp:Transcript_250/g.300  ORF Transcript_250/g.300 Transcript_250/m.300 type:complete len:125 (+) Transcript_250:522-896(+)
MGSLLALPMRRKGWQAWHAAFHLTAADAAVPPALPREEVGAGSPASHRSLRTCLACVAATAAAWAIVVVLGLAVIGIVEFLPGKEDLLLPHLLYSARSIVVAVAAAVVAAVVVAAAVVAVVAAD